MIFGLITAGFTAIGLILGGIVWNHETAVRGIVSACVGIATYILFLGVCFLIKLTAAPVKMEKEDREKAAQDAKEAEGKIAMLQKEKEELLIVVETLSNKKELEREKEAHRKVVKDRLGLFLKIIEHQIIHVESVVDWFTIADKAVEKEISDWRDTKKEISNYLKEIYSDAEAASFERISDMHQTPKDDTDNLPLERKRQRQWLLDQMAHHSKNLNEIIRLK